ncbi:MAG TPA: YtxH domain-containing protein [Candidatus Saccharibacteria bacterium]|nr:YtxH domain-containing protein [Candidatus Saccharibacteria bacterium]HRQ97846.1 YtxH domain-containing protein [Candidatus Saccharibacteria bacterium]
MSKGKFAIGAILGAAAGFVTGILTAPKSGKETRDELKVKAEGVKKDVTVKAKKAARKAESVATDVKTKAEGVATDVKTKATDLKGRTERAVEGAKKGFNSKK